MKKWSVVVALATASFVMLLDSTVMNVSIDDVVNDLHTTVTGMQLAITTYTLVMAATMMIGGRLGDILGRRKVFRMGIVLFAAGAGITAAAPNLAVLIAGWSVLEGLGAALMLPAIQALVAGNYTGRDRATCYGILGGIAAAGASAGPIIGGFVATEWSWRVVFAAEVVIMAGLLVATRVIRDTPPAEPRVRMDYGGGILSAAGLGLVVIGVVQSTTWGWILPKAAPTIGGHRITPLGLSIVPFLILAGIVCLYFFTVWEHRRERQGEAPLVDLALLRIRRLRAGLSTSLTMQLALAGSFFVLPLYLQIVLGKDPIETGIKVLPLSLGVLVVSLLAAKLAARFAPRRIVQVGMSVMLVGLLGLMATIEPKLDNLAFAVSMAVYGIGMGAVFSQLGNINMSSVGTEKASEVGGLQGTAQNLGGALGTALIGSILLTGLGAAFVKEIQNTPSLPPQVRSQIVASTKHGLPFVPAKDVTAKADKEGLSAQAASVTASYAEAQVDALKVAMGGVAALVLLAMLATRGLPMERLVSADADPDPPAVAAAA